MKGIERSRVVTIEDATSAGRIISTSGAHRPASRSCGRRGNTRQRAVSDFLILEILILARVSLGISAARKLIVPLAIAAGVFALCVGACASALAVVFGAEGPTLIGLLVLVASTISGGAFVLGGMVGSRRHAVRMSPHRGLLRALDAPPLPLFMMMVVWRAVPVFGWWSAVALGFVVGAARSIPMALAVLLLLTPLTLGVVHVAAGAYLATRSVRRRIRSTGVILVCLSFAVGLSIAPIVRGIRAGADAIAIPETAFHVACGVDLAIAGVCIFVTARRLAVLRTDPFPAIDPAFSVEPRRVLGLPTAMERQSNHEVWHRSPARVVLAALTCTGVVLGLRLGGLEFPWLTDAALATRSADVDGFAAAWIPTDVATAIRQILIAVVSTCSLLILESWIPFAGPARAMPQLRFAWETGLSRLGVASSVLVAGLWRLVVVGSAGGAVVVLVCGRWSAFVPVLVVAPAAGLAALIADVVVRPARHADDSAGQSVFAGLIATAASSPIILAALLAEDALAAWGAASLTVILGGMTVWRLMHRIHRHSN